MPIDDAYAQVEVYRSRVGKTDDDDDAEIANHLKAVSRLIDRRLERFFTQDAAPVIRLYDGNGEQRLYVTDIATETGLQVRADLDVDGDFTGGDETLTVGTHFKLGPPNAALGPEPQPYRYLQIVPDNGVIARWPQGLETVEVTAAFGWPSVPGAIEDATVMILRQLRDLEQSGFTLTLANMEAGVQMSPGAAFILNDIERQYSRRTLFA